MDGLTRVMYHIGTPMHSGRYPWGSGKDGYLSTSDRLRDAGLSEKEIAASMGISTGELRQQRSVEKMEMREAQRIFISREREKGVSVGAIAKETGLSPQSVRTLLKPMANMKYRIVKKIADILEAAVAKYRFIDIGEGVEQFMGVSRFKMDNAVTMLKNKGYQVFYLREEQLGTGHKTSIMVLGGPNETYADLLEHRGNIAIPGDTITNDNGASFYDRVDPVNIDSSRVKVVYGQEGREKDGLMELRAGVPDLSIGGKSYAQVRIALENTHYLKGMAIPSDDVPAGYDIVFYTSKPDVGDDHAIFKKQDLEGTSPFGAVTKPPLPIGNDAYSAVNIVNEAGDWQTWSSSTSSQFLGKQSPKLAKEQLDAFYNRRQAEFDEIAALTNPVVKRHLLSSFSDTVDSDAVELRGAPFPGQTTKVIIPDPTLKENEIYAPTYQNGDVVTLIRHPHGGIFELPTVTVNNTKGASRGADLIGPDAIDAITVHPKVAEILSGADFDGDNVIVAPNRTGKIKTAPPLEGLKGFDPKTVYPYYEGMKTMTPSGKELEMGKISNLITDMTIRGASEAELARAVRHSMVVIDAEKHKLNYQQSYKDNGITALKKRYQGSSRGGSATVLSRAKSPEFVLKRKDRYAIDPVTGKKVFTYTDESYINKKGIEVHKKTRSTRMYEQEDAHELSSGTVIERVYADHANRLKALGNTSRLEYVNTKSKPYDRAAARTYKNEVDSLNAKLERSIKHQPIERKAQLVAGEMVRTKKLQHPDMSYADVSAEKARSLAVARERIGVPRPVINITPREWEAIQMGAISTTKLEHILRSADQEQVKALATPRTTKSAVPQPKKNKARVLLNNGYTIAEVARAIGVSTYELESALQED